MASFDEVLAQNHLGFTDLLDPKAADDLRSFWDTMVIDRNGNVSDADTDSLINTYKEMGVIADSSDPRVLKARVEAGKIERLQQEEVRRKRAAADLEERQAREAAAGSTESAPAEADNTTIKAQVRDCQILVSDAPRADNNHPMLVLYDPQHTIRHHQTGSFTNPKHRNAFEYTEDTAQTPAANTIDAAKSVLITRDLTAIDKRFIKLLDWLGENHVCVRLSGRPSADGYAVYKIRAVDPNGNDSLSAANNSFLQLVIRRLQASKPPEEITEESENPEDADESLILSDMPSMIDFMRTAGDTLPANIRSWAYRNIAMTKSGTISPEEKRHAQRALSMMLHVQWQSTYFPSIDPYAARRILDEELYGLEQVKQRVIETIIQINRTHTLPGYGLLLVGPAGTGKSQIAYAVARILQLPWTSLDMSTIHDAEALTGSPRVYSNAKPGKIMEAFSNAGASNLVFIINELDKADAAAQGANPADALLTLLDGLGFTDNYIECTIPTSGVYPIATANDKSRISNPLLTRFAVIDIPDYTPDEKKIIFTEYSMPRVLRKMGMYKDECRLTQDGVDAVIERYADLPGVRDLEQAAEHLAANALYRIETQKLTAVTYDRTEVEHLLY